MFIEIYRQLDRQMLIQPPVPLSTVVDATGSDGVAVAHQSIFNIYRYR